MDFNLSAEQSALRDEVIRFAENELNDDLIERDADGTFSPEAWKKCAAFGLQGLPIPSAYGGGGADPLTIVVAMESLGRGCRDNGLIFSLNAQMWSCEAPIVRFGSEDQKRRWLPGLADGSVIGVQAMSEPGAGSDAFGSMATTADMDGDTFVLNGSKTFITNADRRCVRRVRLDRPLEGVRRSVGLPGRAHDAGARGGATAPEDGTANLSHGRDPIR